MPNYKVTYNRVFDYTIEADSLEHAGERAKNFAIGMSKNMGSNVKILSVHPEGYVGPVEPISAPTKMEKMVDGMRTSIDKLLE